MGDNGTDVTALELGIERHHDPAGRRGCPVAGCGCTDGRIVSPRRARFHAYLALTRGETADRVIPSDPEWVLPTQLLEED